MHPLKILIIDDEKYVLEMIQLRLQEEGYDVSIASNALDGIKMAREVKPDLILTDLIMDGVPGIEAIRKLKSDDMTAEIPILVLTGKSLNEDREEAISAGANGFISKPILPNRLIHEIKRFVADGKHK